MLLKVGIRFLKTPIYFPYNSIVQEKIAKFELNHQKNVLDECSSTLEFFIVKYFHISIFSLDVIFSSLTKNM